MVTTIEKWSKSEVGVVSVLRYKDKASTGIHQKVPLFVVTKSCTKVNQGWKRAMQVR